MTYAAPQLTFHTSALSEAIFNITALFSISRCQWFKQCADSGQPPTCPLCVRVHPELPGGTHSTAEGAPAPYACTAAAAATASAAGGSGGCCSCCDASLSHASGSGEGIELEGRQEDALDRAAAADNEAVAVEAAAGVASAEGRATRKRPIGDLRFLTDEHKASLVHKRTAASSRDVQWAVGDVVVARYMARKGGTGWFRGRVTSVHEVPPERGGPARTYDITYDDGDEEVEVLAKNVREARSDDEGK